LASEGRASSVPLKELRAVKSSDKSSQIGPFYGQLALAYSQELFDNFLHWLDPNIERAGEKYEAIRQKLIKFFAVKGSDNPEGLAEETIDRVASKLDQLTKTDVSDPTAYFYGVARKIYLETARQREYDPLPIAIVGTDRAGEQTQSCLEKCLKQLPKSDQDLILQFYSVGREGKKNRIKLAESLGITPNALRVRVFRMRRAMEKCVKSCLQGGEQRKR
jgi:DNA-directed RNA polymerase specialized sigma24 family protein